DWSSDVCSSDLALSTTVAATAQRVDRRPQVLPHSDASVRGHVTPGVLGRVASAALTTDLPPPRERRCRRTRRRPPSGRGTPPPASRRPCPARAPGRPARRRAHPPCLRRCR